MIKSPRTLKYGEIIGILGEIYKEGETGTLLCQNGPVAKYIYFQNGQIIFAASNALEDKFTQILLEEGKVKEEQLDMAMEKKGNKTIAKALTELGFISSSELIESLLKQVERIVLSILNWENGTASFKPESLPQGVAKLPIQTQRFILDLAKKIENRHFAMQVIGGIDKVMVIHKAEKDVVLSLPLSQDELEIARLCDGERSIEQISSLCNKDAFTVSKFFIGLHYLGLIRQKKVVTSLEDDGKKEEVKEEDKKIDLSFLEQAIPTTLPEQQVENQPSLKMEENKVEETPFEKLLPKQETPFTPVVVEQQPVEEKKVRVSNVTPSKKEEEKVEKKTDSFIQEPLFQPSFLNLEEDKQVNKNVGKKPQVLLPPPNLMPEKKNKLMKFVLIPLITIVVMIGIIFSIYFFFLKEEETTKQPPPPKSLPKNSYTAENEVAKKEQSQTTSIPNIIPQKKETNPVIQEAPKVEAKNEVKETPKVEQKQPPQEAKKENVVAEKVEKEIKKEEPPKSSQKLPEKEISTSQSPYSSLSKGDYQEAAKQFKSIYSTKSGGFTIALMIACEKDSITKALSELKSPDKLIIFPHNFKGRDCFRVLYGYYNSKEEAQKEFSTLPPDLQASGAKVIPFEKMKP